MELDLIFEQASRLLNLKKRDKNVAILALGSRPRQGVARLRAKKGSWESCHMLPGVQESVGE
jgi:hypothetical protein